MDWNELSIYEKANLMKLYVANGVTDLNTIKEHYNSFQDGGDTKKPRGYRVSSAIMNIAHKAVDKNAANTIDTPYNGAPQSTFLMNRKNQQKVFEDEGYTKVDNNDYGPVANAVNTSRHKDVPIYQKYPNVNVDRNNLQKVGTFMDYAINNANTKTNVYNGPVESYLTDPANFPVDVYIDRKTGKVYNQGWDYNDYNNIRSTTGVSKLKNVAGNILDRIGNPTVVTTGLQENTIKSTEADRYLQSKNPMLSYQKNEDTGEYEIMMKPVTVTAKRTNPVKPKVELRPASELNADEFWDMMEANSRQNGGHLYQEGGPTNNKSDWAKAHETELALHQLGWDNPDNKLHSDYAAKDDEGYYAGYNLKPVTVRPSVQQQLRDLGKNNPKTYGIVEQFDPEAVKFNNQWGLGLWTILAGAKAPELIKDATVKGFETLNRVYNPTKWYGAGLTAATSAGPLVNLTDTSNYTDENGKYNTDNAWNNISNWTTDVIFASPAFNAGKQGVKAATNAFKYNTTLGRNMTIVNELRKGINGSTLTTAPVENAVHNRFRLGDVEINNPNIFYRQGNGPLAEDLIKSGIIRTRDTGKRQMVGTLNLTKPTQSNAMFNKGRIAFDPESDMGKNLVTTAASDKMHYSRPKTWSGENVYVNNWQENPITKSEANAYLYERNYGYRRIQESIPTLEQAYQEAINNQQKNPIVFARSLADEGLDNVLRDNYLEGSPSFALTKYSNDNLDRLSELYANNKGITFLFGKNAAGNNAKYFVGDADTPIRQDAARALNLPATEEAINNITPEQVMLGKRLLHKDINSTPINWREAFNLTRENNFGDMDYFYNEVLLDKILDYRDAIGAIVNTNKPQYIKMLEDLGIPYGYNLTDIPFNFKGFQQGGSLGKVTSYGQWQYPHQITTIPSNNITMKGVNYPVIGVSNTGDAKYMLPNMDYLFDGQYVTEYPINI